MKASTIAAMTASALMALTAPTAGLAQPYHHGWDHGPGPGGPGAPAGWDLDRRIDWLQHRIDRGRDDGSLDRREAFRVQRALDDIRQDERRMRYRNGGRLNDRQRDMLQDRLDRVSDRIRWLRHNDERRPW